MINSIFGQSPNPYRQEPVHHQPVFIKTEPIIQTNLNPNSQNPNCPMYKNPNQKEQKEGSEFNEEKANKVFNPYCLICSQSLCNIKNLIENGVFNLAEYNSQNPLLGSIINLEV